MFNQPQNKRRFALEVFKTPSTKRKSLFLKSLPQKRQKIFQLFLYTLLFTLLLSLEHILERLWSAPDSAPYILLVLSGNFAFCLVLNLFLSFTLVVYFPHIGQKVIHLTLIYLTFALSILMAQLVAIFQLSPFFIPMGFVSYLFALVFGPLFALMMLPLLFLYVGHSLYSAFLEQTITNSTLLFSWTALSLRDTFVLFLGAMIMIGICNQVNRRNKLTIAGIKLALAHLVFLILFFLVSSFPSASSLLERKLLEEFGFAIASGLLTGFLLSSVLPFLESIFDFTTDISLLELSSGNNALLERMLLEAPGTFHHSMMVGILAEAAADAIGARSLLAKVGAYYHDIGKLARPHYFTENENYQGSKHDNLSPILSTIIILAHVKDGVELAKLFNLPSAVVDIICQHHGCGTVQYFYVEALNDPNYRETFPENREKENKEFFRYPGPKAKTKEAAIVLIADSVEAASRSLSDPSPAKLEILIEKIIHSKLMDQQLEECNLTFKELNAIKQSLLKMLISLFHTRVKYPEAPKSKP